MGKTSNAIKSREIHYASILMIFLTASLAHRGPKSVIVVVVVVVVLLLLLLVPIYLESSTNLGNCIEIGEILEIRGIRENLGKSGKSGKSWIIGGTRANL